jgi:hypothetical protein
MEWSLQGVELATSLDIGVCLTGEYFLGTPKRVDMDVWAALRVENRENIRVAFLAPRNGKVERPLCPPHVAGR